MSEAGRTAAARLAPEVRDAVQFVGDRHPGPKARQAAAVLPPGTLEHCYANSILYHSTTTDTLSLTAWGQELYNGLLGLAAQQRETERRPHYAELQAIGEALASVDRKREIIMTNLAIAARSAEQAGVPITTIAELCGVTRQTVYDRLRQLAAAEGAPNAG